MKLLTLLVFLSFLLPCRAQDSLFKKKHLTSAEIEAFYSFYTQDGNHSAVTGGTGTENLHVHDVGFNLAFTLDSAHTIIVETYLDAITSASTDNIDYIVSSASREDNHISFHLGYQYSAKRTPLRMGIKYLFGMESDFMSNGVNLWVSLSNKLQTRSYSLSLVMYFDDLRWGRFSEDAGYKPTTLIYPVELRYKQWFDIYNRYSYNFNFSLRQDVNKRLAMQVDIGTIYQTGLISTSFHRIYFADSDSVKVENLPRQRLQFPLGVGLNAFVGRALLLKLYYRFYWDDIGITAHSLNLETPVKFSYKYTLYPFFRIYRQTASTFFKPYGRHSIYDEFYTSDYDLSAFTSYKIGMGFGFFPGKVISKNYWLFNSIVLRYAYYGRTDGLSANMLSLLLNLGK